MQFELSWTFLEASTIIQRIDKNLLEIEILLTKIEPIVIIAQPNNNGVLQQPASPKLTRTTNISKTTKVKPNQGLSKIYLHKLSEANQSTPMKNSSTAVEEIPNSYYSSFVCISSHSSFWSSSSCHFRIQCTVNKKWNIYSNKI